MSVTFDIDQTRFNQQLSALALALNVDGRDLVRGESRLFLKQAIGFTPPKSLEQGKGAVKRDLGRAFSVVSDNWLSEIGSEHGTGSIDTWVTFKDGRKVNLVWNKIDPSGSGMSAFHHSVRNNRGRVNRKHHTITSTRWNAQYVVARPDFNARSIALQNRVGRQKAGWVPAYSSVGGKAPSWVAKHSNAPGYVVDGLQARDKPSITIQNHAPGISALAGAVRGALQVRIKSIARKVKLVLRGYRQDMKTGRLIAPGKTKAFE